MRRMISTVFGFAIFSTPNFYSIAKTKVPAKCATLAFEKAYKRAGAVFVGNVLNISKEGNTKTVKFKVIKYWKGIEKTIVTVSVYENPRFQAPYKEGKRYLVFAKSKEKSGFWDGRCSRSRDIEGFSPSLKDDLKALGKSKTCISLDN